MIIRHLHSCMMRNNYWDRFSKYNENKRKNEIGTTFLAMEKNVYVEKNNSWYVDSPNHPKKYFNDVDDLLRFIYKDPMIPQYCMFSPGYTLLSVESRY